VTKILKAALAAWVGVAALSAHPMGNFSVNHYARIEVGQPSTDVLFVLDLAELPTFELLQRWGLQGTSARADLRRKATAESRSWVRQLRFTVNGKRVAPVWESADLVVADGAGGLPVMRINTHLKLAAAPGTLQYLDETYPDRTAGWKEVVVQAKAGTTIERNTAGTTERSQALTAYPQDPLTSPPQELTAAIDWKGAEPVMTSAGSKPAEKPRPTESDVRVDAPQLPTPATGATVAEPNSGGQVRRGDFLSTTLQGKEIGWGLGLICVAVAFWFGALHALEPGHGKTMVAAYLVGERGTPKHAILLGGMVTFTHTVSVFILGLLTMFLAQYIRADLISKWLGVISGLTIVWIGGLLFYRRARSLGMLGHSHAHTHSHGDGHTHSHEHGHSHSHEPVTTKAHLHEPHSHTHTHGDEHAHLHQHGHSHSHEPVTAHTHSHEPHSHPHTHGDEHAHLHQHGHSHSHEPVTAHTHSNEPHSHPHTHAHGEEHTHSHSHGALTHTHDGHTHSHVIEGEISMKSLMALGASGGLVPCPSALVLLLAAVSVGRTGFGLLLLISFSLGLALVLMATGLVVLYAKRFIPERKDRRPNPLSKILPVVSAAVITLIGVVLTGNALGLIPVIRFFG